MDNHTVIELVKKKFINKHPEMSKKKIGIFIKKNCTIFPNLVLEIDGDNFQLSELDDGGGEGVMMMTNDDFWTMMCFDSVNYRYSNRGLTAALCISDNQIVASRLLI